MPTNAGPSHPSKKDNLGLRPCPARTPAAYYEEASMPTTNATNSVFPSLVPTEVRALFGDPPLLRGEEASLYNNLMDQFSRLVEPKDMIEWWWVKDITDHTWGIRRLRRFEVLFVELRRDKVVDNRKHWNTLGENVKYVPVPAPDGKKDGQNVPAREPRLRARARTRQREGLGPNVHGRGRRVQKCRQTHCISRAATGSHPSRD